MKKNAFHDPAQVARDLAAAGHRGAAADVARGGVILDAGRDFAHGAAAAGRTAINVADKLLEPSAAGPAFLRGAGRLAKRIGNSPGAMRFGAGALLAAPIISSAFHDSQQAYEDPIMNARRDPTRVITASLDEFLEKKAMLRVDVSTEKVAGAVDYLRAAWRGATTGVKGPLVGKVLGAAAATGLAGAVGGGLMSALGKGISKGYDTLDTALFQAPKREQLFAGLVRTDPVLTDAVRRDPKAQVVLEEAFQTMVRYAPHLSVDINAVRSFLREAVIGGGGVNYATIKNLVETEKTITGDRRPK